MEGWGEVVDGVKGKEETMKQEKSECIKYRYDIVEK